MSMSIDLGHIWSWHIILFFILNQNYMYWRRKLNGTLISPDVIFVIFQVVSAQDEGAKSSNTTVNIRVTDVNDQDPVFKNLPYSFRVEEGEVGAFVGRVIAEDGDEG